MIDKLITILAVCIGGVITFFTTIYINKITTKRNSLTKARDDVYVPLCIVIESLISSLSISNSIPILYEKSDVQQKICKVFEYLSADKRIFLEKSIRNQLESLRDILNAHVECIENESSSATITIMHKLSDSLRSFSNIDYAMYIYVHIDNKDVKRLMLEQKDINPIPLITNIMFEFNDDPDNYKAKSYPIAKDFYLGVVSALNSGYVSEDDLGLDDDDKMKVELLEFMCENNRDAVAEFNVMLSQSKAHTFYNEFVEVLRQLHISTVNRIDYITDL
jgi:hypothetical protein